MSTTAENELRTMIGDLFMQVAMLRADTINMREAQPEPEKQAKHKANGKEASHDDGGHPQA